MRFAAVMMDGVEPIPAGCQGMPPLEGFELCGWRDWQRLMSRRKEPHPVSSEEWRDS